MPISSALTTSWSRKTASQPQSSFHQTFRQNVLQGTVSMTVSSLGQFTMMYRRSCIAPTYPPALSAQPRRILLVKSTMDLSQARIPTYYQLSFQPRTRQAWNRLPQQQRHVLSKLACKDATQRTASCRAPRSSTRQQHHAFTTRSARLSYGPLL